MMQLQHFSSSIKIKFLKDIDWKEATSFWTVMCTGDYIVTSDLIQTLVNQRKLNEPWIRFFQEDFEKLKKKEILKTFITPHYTVNIELSQ